MTIMLAFIGLSSMATPFNEGWTFWSDSDEKKVQVTLPHDAMIHEKRSADVMGGSAVGYFPGGVYHYEKTLEVPSEWLEKNVVLRCEGVYKDAKVYVNNVLAGGYPNGYAQFDVCLDDLIHEGNNIIRVDTDNAQGLDSRFYSGAGIYRPVHLLVREKKHISLVRVTTESILPPTIKVCVESTGGDATIEILDGGKVIAAKSGDEATFEIPGAQLWDEDTPYLYTVKATLDNGEALTDTFGIRTLEWDRNGFRVNGKTVLLKGGCIHSDNGILGAAEYDEAAERRIRILKSFGFNAIRSAHNPCSEAILRACDKYGVYVMDELWDMWFKAKNPYDYSNHFKEYFLSDIAKMVEKDYNHPSVVMYSIGNEVSEILAPGGPEAEKAMIKRLHSLDSTRPVTVGLNVEIARSAIPANPQPAAREKKSGEGMNLSALLTGGGLDSQKWNEMMHAMGINRNNPVLTPEMEAVLSEVVDPLDIAGYNYGSGRYPIENDNYPDRVVVGSETFPTTLFSNWELVKKYPAVIGDFLWTAWDYIGETGLGAWDYTGNAGFMKPFPWKYSGAGMIDSTGEPTAEAFQAKTVFDPEDDTPYICVQPVMGTVPRKSAWRSSDGIRSWSWSGCEGRKAVVEVYANSDKVRLLLNGKKVGEEKVIEGVATFEVPYSPGKLEAVSYGGKSGKAKRDMLVSASGDLSLTLSPENSHAVPGQIVFIGIDIKGENGERESMKDREIRLHVEGGELLGLGSADNSDEGNDDDSVCLTHFGHALAVVRAGNEGKITLRAEASDLATGNCEIPIK